MKGIILAGGTGSRLFPITTATSKQLLPVYDKPMIYYPLSVLMLSKIRDVAIISNKHFLPQYKRLLGNGERIGMNISYIGQSQPDGIPSALKLATRFVGKDKVALILGDNIIYGPGLSKRLRSASSKPIGATIFAFQVKNPHAFGVVEISPEGDILDIIEKPKFTKSKYAIMGLYFFDNQVFNIIRDIKPSERGETEITDVINHYRERSDLDVELLGRGYTWFDAGTIEDLHEASKFVRTIQKTQGYLVGCLEEIALQNKWISYEKIRKNHVYGNTRYSEYLSGLIDG